MIELLLRLLSTNALSLDSVSVPVLPFAHFLPQLVMPFSCKTSIFVEVSPHPILQSVHVVAFGRQLAVFVKCGKRSMTDPSGTIARKIARVPVSELSALVKNLGNIHLQNVSPVWANDPIFAPSRVAAVEWRSVRVCCFWGKQGPLPAMLRQWCFTIGNNAINQLQPDAGERHGWANPRKLPRSTRPP